MYFLEDGRCLEQKFRLGSGQNGLTYIKHEYGGALDKVTYSSLYSKLVGLLYHLAKPYSANGNPLVQPFFQSNMNRYKTMGKRHVAISKIGTTPTCQTIVLRSYSLEILDPKEVLFTLDTKSKL
ncbi:hypothetical protein VNO77_28778 [Canavalia gladiata]|uniref:Uncharacterized protein n=1 Tax=Canavalia gladiata TaxID=3824 RepID=A0AAN9KYP3_CANGL